ncbi:MAG: NUDIX domain-containing protein [Patescibacteria group bacterium]|jgi:8-oxo-dGTP diphosphatase
MKETIFLLIIAESTKLIIVKKQGNKLFSKTKTADLFKNADSLTLINQVFKLQKNQKLNGIFLSIEKQSFSSTRALVSIANALAYAYNCKAVELKVSLPSSQISKLFTLGKNELSKTITQFIKPTYLNLPNITKPKLKINEFHICSGALVYDQVNKKFLFIRRKDTKKIGLPKGHQEKNENLGFTAKREAGEETGYSDLKLIGKLKSIKYKFTVKGELHEKTEHQFLLLLNSSKTKNRLSTGEVKNLDNLWLTPQQALLDPNLYPNLQDTIKKAIFILKKRNLF